jgi:hypothetical protein
MSHEQRLWWGMPASPSGESSRPCFSHNSELMMAKVTLELSGIFLECGRIHKSSQDSRRLSLSRILVECGQLVQTCVEADVK